jgi:hypothetical protein
LIPGKKKQTFFLKDDDEMQECEIIFISHVTLYN